MYLHILYVDKYVYEPQQQQQQKYQQVENDFNFIYIHSNVSTVQR